MCELLWSDPQHMAGRAPSKRGVGCQFGPDVTANFLQKNKLDYIIRSHEVKNDGYEVMHDGKCITVFSAPNYWWVLWIALCIAWSLKSPGRLGTWCPQAGFSYQPLLRYSLDSTCQSSRSMSPGKSSRPPWLPSMIKDVRCFALLLQSTRTSIRMFVCM